MEEEGAETAKGKGIFRPGWEGYNRPGRIVTLGSYLAVDRLLDAHGQMRYAREVSASTGYHAGADTEDTRRAVQWTRWITALNAGRKWPLKRLTERIAPGMEAGVAVVIVPSHDP